MNASLGLSVDLGDGNGLRRGGGVHVLDDGEVYRVFEDNLWGAAVRILFDRTWGCLERDNPWCQVGEGHVRFLDPAFPNSARLAVARDNLWRLCFQRVHYVWSVDGSYVISAFVRHDDQMQLVSGKLRVLELLDQERQDTSERPE